jgi:hypothetical protein
VKHLTLETQLSASQALTRELQAEVESRLSSNSNLRLKLDRAEATIERLEAEAHENELVRRKLHNMVQELKGESRPRPRSLAYFLLRQPNLMRRQHPSLCPRSPTAPNRTRDQHTNRCNHLPGQEGPLRNCPHLVLVHSHGHRTYGYCLVLLRPRVRTSREPGRGVRGHWPARTERHGWVQLHDLLVWPDGEWEDVDDGRR